FGPAGNSTCTVRTWKTVSEESIMSNWSPVVRSVVLFFFAGICEVGGGWLVWKWLRDHKPLWWGVLGALFLVSYGMIPTLQASHFGRIYAAYGGFFIVLSLLWGWGLDGNRPDRADAAGELIALVGVCVMMYWPRS